HAEQRSGPDEVIASGIVISPRDYDIRAAKCYRLMSDFAVGIHQATRQKADQPLLGFRQTVVESEQLLQRLRFLHAVSIEQPDPIKAMRQRMPQSGDDGAASTEVSAVADYCYVGREHTVEGRVGRTVIDDDDGVGRSGLAPQFLEYLPDYCFVVQRMDM